MPTVIDSLILEIGLDPKKFTTGQKEALEAFGKTKEGARKAAGDIEDSGNRAADAFRSIRTQVLALGAAFLGARAIKDFVGDVGRTDNAAGRLARTLDIGVGVLSAWRGAAVLVGGTAAGIEGSMKALVGQFQTFALTGESSVIPYFRALNIQIADTAGRMRPVNDIMLDLADSFSKLDPARAAAFGKALGFDDGTINLLIQGRAAVTALLDKQKELGVITKEDAEAGAALVASWGAQEQAATALGRYLVTGLTPALVGVLDWTTKLISTFNQWLHSNDTWVDRLDRLSGGALSAVLGKPRPRAPGATATPGEKAPGSSAEVEAYIRDSARRHGIDPDVAVAVAKSEGLNGYVGDRGSSFGPFQLHYGNVAGGGMAVSGLGDTFTRQTGLDARDPATTKQQIDFAMEQAARGGWGPWHGWHGSPTAGIGAGAAASSAAIGQSTSTSSSETKIDQLIVNSASSDATGIAADIKEAVGRSSRAQQSNNGQN